MDPNDPAGTTDPNDTMDPNDPAGTTDPVEGDGLPGDCNSQDYADFGTTCSPYTYCGTLTELDDFCKAMPSICYSSSASFQKFVHCWENQDPTGTTDPNDTMDSNDPAGTTDPNGTMDPNDPAGTTDPNDMMVGWCKWILVKFVQL
jgi:hypothetical protein